MLVDDNISLTKTMSFILRRKGYTVVTSKSGMEAIERVKERSFDIVFMDIKMPLMNGVETYKEIKKIKPETVVIMMTAYSVEDLVQEALQEGAHGIIYKPLDIDNVIGLIKNTMTNSSGALILVVDDDPGTYKTLKMVLSKKGYDVTVCTNGDEAIALSLSNNFDILFIDMKLPTINGLETYLEIKKNRNNVIAIIITGFRHEVADLVDEAMMNSAYACLYKPLSMERVLKIIDEVIQRKESALTE